MKRMNNEGKASTALIIGIVAVIIIMVMAVALVAVYAQKNKPGEDAEDKDRDGNGEPDPIIGYVDTTVRCVFDNGAWGGEYTQRIQSVTSQFNENPPMQSIWAQPGSLYAQTNNWRVIITMSNSGLGAQFTDTVNFNVAVGGGAVITMDIESSKTFNIRYHGTYHVTAELLLVNSDGSTHSVTTQSIDPTF